MSKFRATIVIEYDVDQSYYDTEDHDKQAAIDEDNLRSHPEVWQDLAAVFSKSLTLTVEPIR